MGPSRTWFLLSISLFFAGCEVSLDDEAVEESAPGDDAELDTIDLGAFKITGLEVINARDPNSPRKMAAFANIHVFQDQKTAETAIAVKPVGGSWTQNLDFNHMGAWTYHPWEDTALGQLRVLPVGTYVAHVAFRRPGASTWLHDEVTYRFSVP